MSVRYSEDFKKEVVKAYMAGNKSIPQIAIDYNIAKSFVSKWFNEYMDSFYFHQYGLPHCNYEDLVQTP